ncbi:MAG: hypothetical protein KJ727_01395 [Acidobacteria bacterium]|nr:hypothetical protein [Acidobacteriota bacterium]MCG2815915.1 hypothetical protein [Candidatus Aminicenantes bacterium]
MARDLRFVAVHRGGSLELDRHRQLALWAAVCAEHVQLPPAIRELVLSTLEIRKFAG